ncbi:MAG TPA: PKD-like family lipoprotein [Pedobacter sp.]|uniref:PKD-like family lipoprotein n=1 Tax=Pedobacter sp. TaxID=1411316 RepID=UPI002BC5980B|nr:PKD-like family lipoprotein [Pedobacter sp.]HMI03992.1 PKD-like family lipoprotein [Pedobacter sp.]
MKIKFILTSILLGLCTLFISSCVKDKGNYDFSPADAVSVNFGPNITAFVGDSIKYQPVRTFKDKNDSVYFDHAWYVAGKLYSNTPEFKYYASEFAGIVVKYYMTDRRNGLIYTTPSYLGISISSPFTSGWSLLYEDAAGNSEVGHITYNATTTKYTDYTGLYQKANNEPMGKQPYKIFPYTMRGTNGIFVIQYGGQGSLDLGGNDYKKKLVASKSFTREVPNPFEPVDLAFFNATDLLVNSNGDMYGRFFNGAAAFTIPWMSSPLSVEKGMKITDIWDSWYKTSNLGVMYDKLNKRMLFADGSLFYPGGGIVIRQFPLPKNGYPGNYTSLQDLGNWEYVWGSSFIDNYDNINGGMLIRSPDDRKLYFQNFEFKTSGPILTPLRRVPFLGSDLVDNKSIYLAIRNRNYLFFTGTGGKDLYYFDVETGATMKTYEKFTDKITTVEMDHDSRTIAVGLENGTVIIYDISNEVLLSGKSKEVHRLTGLGKVVHVAFKSYKI